VITGMRLYSTDGMGDRELLGCCCENVKRMGFAALLALPKAPTGERPGLLGSFVPRALVMFISTSSFIEMDV
jgi:hypothetical protein